MKGAMKVAAATVLLLAVLPTADASHFRYATMRWRFSDYQVDADEIAKSYPDHTDKDPKDYFSVELTLELAIRRSWCGEWYDNQVCSNVDDVVDIENEMIWGSGGGLNGEISEKIKDLVVTVSREDDDISMGLWVKHKVLLKSKTYNVIYTSCCRLKNINNNANKDWRLATKVSYNAAGHKSPTSSYLPIIEVASKGTQRFTMVALEPNRDGLIWSLASNEEMDGPDGQPSNNGNIYNINADTGRVSFKTDNLDLGLYCTQIMVSGKDSPNIKVPIDFFILISDSVDVCVDACSNYGAICSGEQTGCEGDCLVYNKYHSTDPCMPNLLPKIELPHDITDYIGNPVIFDVAFEENAFYEYYQHLTIQTGTLPRGSVWTWHDKPHDAGYGHLEIGSEYTQTPIQYAACFMANDGYIFGPPACMKIDIQRWPVPPVVAPAKVENYVMEELEVSLHFGNEYGGDYAHLGWLVEGEQDTYTQMPGCVEFHTENHDEGQTSDGSAGHGYSAVLYIPLACSFEPINFKVCFTADDIAMSDHSYGETSCTEITLKARPDIDCFGDHPTLEECSTQPLCFWDGDGVDESHDPGPKGCYDFFDCHSMDNTKSSCLGHTHCHYGAFGDCIHLHHESQQYNKNETNGDHCRQYSKKECREVDGNTHSTYFHCGWDPINEWCTTEELHIPHTDLCRSVHTKAECKKAVRNGMRCNWKRDYGPAHGPNKSPGKCVGDRNPINGNDDGMDTTIVNAGHDLEKKGTSTLNYDFFTVTGHQHDDLEPGLFNHDDHHFATDRVEQYTEDPNHPKEGPGQGEINHDLGGHGAKPDGY